MRNARAIRAWVADAPAGGLALETLDLDEIRPGEVLVRVAAVGVCHTDIAYTDGSRPTAPFPLVAGHEGAGVIAAVGEATEGFAVGDRVLMSFSSCGRCRGCLAGAGPLLLLPGAELGFRRAGQRGAAHSA